VRNACDRVRLQDGMLTLSTTTKSVTLSCQLSARRQPIPSSMQRSLAPSDSSPCYAMGAPSRKADLQLRLAPHAYMALQTQGDSLGAHLTAKAETT
jgi:hypothetical protein